MFRTLAKGKLLFGLVLAVVMSASAFAADEVAKAQDEQLGENLIANGSFEEKSFKGRYLGIWYGPNYKLSDNAYSLDSTEAHEGSRSLKLVNDGKEKIIFCQAVKDLKPDTEYMLVYYVKLDGVEKKGRYSGVCANLFDGKNHNTCSS